MNPRRAILVFLKFPRPGTVKTRIAQDAGDDAAAEIYRQLAERVIEIVATAPADAIWLFGAPADQCEAIGEWLWPKLASATAPVIDIRPQADGDLGDRLKSAFQQAFDAGFDRVAAIGTDCIDLKADSFSETWAALDPNTDADADAVFGPATDGGYYLIALRHNTSEIFTGIPWSTPETLAHSLHKAENAGLKVRLLEQLTDIDTLADWEAALTRLPQD